MHQPFDPLTCRPCELYVLFSIYEINSKLDFVLKKQQDQILWIKLAKMKFHGPKLKFAQTFRM